MRTVRTQITESSPNENLEISIGSIVVFKAGQGASKLQSIRDFKFKQGTDVHEQRVKNLHSAEFHALAAVPTELFALK